MSQTEAILNLIKSFVGAGVLGLPYAYMKGGLLGSMIGMAVVTLFTNYCMKLLVKVKRYMQDQGFKNVGLVDIGQEMYGTPGYVLVWLTLVFTQLSCCVAYLIFIARSLNYFFKLPYFLFVLLLVPPMVLLSLIRNMKHLTPASTAGNVAIFGSLVAILVYSVVHRQHDAGVEVLEIATYPVFLGIATFAMEGVCIAIPVEDAMEEPEKFSFVLNVVTGFLFVLYNIIGATCYACLGTGTHDVISLNVGGATGVIVKVLLSLVLAFTYPIQLYPVSVILDRALKSSAASASHLVAKENAGRAALVMSTALVAICIPNFAAMLSIMGAVCMGLLAYILPPLFHQKIFSSQTSQGRKAFDFAVVVFGLFAMVAGVVVNIIDLLR